MKILNCIITYNRPYYLKNTVDSLMEYFRFGDILVVDDASEDERQIAYLKRLESGPVKVIYRPDDREQQSNRGGLYAAMNEALEYANSRHYDYIQFIQDDMQFLWHDRRIMEKIQTIFKLHEDALHVTNTFLKKITKYQLLESKRVEIFEQSRSYHFQPYSVMDHGFLNVQRCREVGYYILSEGEKVNSAHWRSKGFKSYMLHAPTLAWIPWPQAYRDRDLQVWGRRSLRALTRLTQAPGRPKRKYYLTPLNPEQATLLQSKPMEAWPFVEDYSRPWGWTCLYPYWFGVFSTKDDLRAYMNLIKGFWRNGEYALPRLTYSF